MFLSFVFLSFEIFSVIGGCNIGFNFPDSETPIIIPTNRLNLLQSRQETILKKSPVFFPLLRDGKQFLPLHTKHSFMISCPGNGNFITNTGKAVGVFSCKNKNKLYLDDKLLTSHNVSCERTPRASLRTTKIACGIGRQGKALLIGWSVNAYLFVPYIKICWNFDTASPYYTDHIIHGRFLKERIASPGRPSFRSNGMFPNDVQQFYGRKSQTKLIAPLLSLKLPRLGSRNYFFSRGHLAPDADFILPAEQDGTYFYANVVPQFQTFNNQEWKVLENGIRNMASDRRKDIRVITGQLNILKLEDINGNNLEIYLDMENHLYPAPEIMYKVVMDKPEENSVAILGLNKGVRPKFQEQRAFESLCKNICQNIKWIRSIISEMNQFNLICCSLSDFRLLSNISKLSL